MGNQGAISIRPLLESARRKTAPRKVELYEVFCAVLYLLRGQDELMPGDVLFEGEANHHRRTDRG